MDAHESMRFAKIEDYLPNGPVTLRLISQAFLLESPQTEAVETESDLTPRQQQALDLVRETKGLYQIDLWKELDVSSRTGTWIATVLEEKRMIERESAVHNGHSTYLLIPRKQDLDFSLLMAEDLFVPFVGEEQVNPQSNAFTDWLLQLSSEYQKNSGVLTL